MAKKMKKLLALVLTIAMVLSFMSVGAFAAGSEETGTEPAVTQTEETQTTTYTVTVQYVDANGNEIAGSYVTEPAEGGSYDVTAYDQITIEGYTYRATSGDALSGTLDGNKVITVTYTKIPVKEALDLTLATEDAVAEDNTWEWDAAALTLTLNGATIDSSKDDVSAPAIKLPDGATIVVNGVNTIHASDDQNGIICAGALTIQGNGTLNVSCNYGIYANTVSIEDIALNIDAAVIGIYAYNAAGDASVELTNVSGTIVGGSYAGIFVDCEYSGANSSCVLDGCDLTVISNATRTDKRCRRSGIAVYSGIASVVCTMEIKDSIVDATGYDAGLGMNSYANGAATATMLIENSTVNATATSNGWAGIFASTIGKTEDDVCIITIKNSDVAAQGVGIGIMTSADCGVSEVNIDDSSVMVSGETAGIRVRNNGSGAKTATFTNNALLVVAGQPANVIDEGTYTLNDTSKIVTATEGSITANGDGTFAIAKGSEVTAEYAAEPVAYTFYMQAGGIGGNGYADREIWGYDTFSEKNWTADEIIIYNEDELHEFALITQGKHPVEDQRDFAGQTVKLGADIALRDYWYHRDAQGTIVTDYRISDFDGAFDGCDYTISNMKYLDEYAAATEEVPLSLFIEMDGTMENLTLDGVTVSTVAPTRFGALINDYSYQLDGTYVKDCTVKNISLTGKTGSKLVFGGMFWKILGSPEIEDCHVENLTVNTDGALSGTSTGRCGGFFATGGEGGSLIKNCSVKNFVVNTSSVINYVGGFAGGTSGMTYEDCEVDGFSVNMENKAKTHRTVGGFIGYTEGNGWDEPLVIKNCHVKDLDLDLGVSSTSTDKKGDAGFIGLFNNTTAGITIEDCSAAGSIKVDGDMTVGGFLGQPYKAPKNVEIKNCTTSVNVTTNGSAGGFVGSYAPLNANTITYTNCTATGDVFGKESVGSFLDADETTVDGIIGGTYNYDPENVDTETGETNNVADGYRALDNGDGTWTVFPDNGKEVVKVAFHRWNDKLNNYENWRTVEVFKDVDFFEAAHNNALNCSHPDYRFSNGIAELDEEADDKTEQVFGFWADAPDSTKLVLDNEIEVLADMNVYAVYGDFVCEIVETGVKYLTLTAAVADANALGTATIQMLKSIDFDSTKALAITGNVTIIGEHTISRGDYTGTMFSVAKNATLTLDGGLVIDGGNNWTFDSANYYADMAAGKTLSTGAKNSYTTSNGIVATAAMITISGTNGAVVMNRATIQNNWADNHNGGALFSVPAGATLTMNDGALIQHIRGSVAGQIKGTWTMNDGKIDDVYGHNTNGALVDIRGGTFTINGGEITNVRTLGLNANGNGILAQVYGESSKLNINGGYIHDNDSFSPGNGWGSVVYLNRGGDFTMTGGTIKATKSDHCTAFVSNAPTSIELLGGTIEVDPSMANWFDSLFYGNVTVAEGMEIVGTEDAFFCMLGDTQYTLDIDGQISGGTIWLMHNVPVTGNGTITSDVLVKADPDYFGFDGKVTVTETTKWLNSLITVDSVGSDAFLTVDSGVVIDGVQVRVLGSVASGEYTNAGESAAEQAAAYIEQTGATVESPVLFYHRLTSAQKSDIVVTFDYNGGLDAQNWSGCQITSAEAFAPTCPEPTKDGYVLIGWKYAVDNDPESLSMAGTADYAGETIAQSVRLIAQWGRECTVTYVGYYGNEMQTLTAKTGDAVPEYSGWMVPVRFPDGNYYYTFRGWNLTEGTLGADGKVGITDLVYTATFDAHEIEDIFTPFFPTGSNETVIDDEPVALAGIPAAFREDHIAYIIGRDDGLVHPEANITRAEVAMIFYRLLNDETRELYTTTESYFPDVNEGDWYNTAVSTLNAMGIILGKPDGTFAPNAYITRAEFAAIAARFDPTASTEGGFFTDIAGHWAELEINMAANNGWVEGYNGLFRPDENITRAEAMTMVNRVLLRVPESVEDLLDGMIVWADNMDTEQWYYLAVQEATNSHDYGRKENEYEFWTALTTAPDWAALEY